MRTHRMLIMVLMIFTTSVWVQAQDELRAFSSIGEPQFSFLYPADWSIEADSSRTYFVDSDDTTVLIEVVAAVDDPFIIDALSVEGEPDLSVGALLGYYFGEAGYSTPQTTAYDLNDDSETNREIGVISDELEDVYALFITPDYFALAFVGGAGRGDNADAIETILTTLTLGPASAIIQPDTDPDVVDSDRGPAVTFGGATATLEVLTLEGRILTLEYPGDLIADDFGGAAFMQTEDEAFTLIITADIGFGFELFGGEGNPDEIATPRELIGAVLAGDMLGEGDDELSELIEETRIGDHPVAVLQAGDENGDFALIGVEIEPGMLALVVVVTDEDTYVAYADTVEAIIASLEIE